MGQFICTTVIPCLFSETFVQRMRREISLREPSKEKSEHAPQQIELEAGWRSSVK